jgi:hypothetical protein
MIVIILFLLLIGCNAFFTPTIGNIYMIEPAIPNMTTPTYTPFTPSREVSPTPSANLNIPCEITIRQPSANAPTRIPDMFSTPSVSDVIDPHVAFCVSTFTPQVGDMWQIYLKPIDIGLPVYQLTFTNRLGKELFVEFNPATDDTTLRVSNFNALTLYEVQTVNNWEVILTFIVRESDEIDVIGRANGEVHYGYPGPATWTSVSFEPFALIITR